MCIRDRVKTQASHKAVKVRSREVVENLQQLLNRIICVCDSPLKLKNYLEYELASRPPCLFDDVSLRKTNKSTTMNVFEKGTISEEGVDFKDAFIVVDGGFFLHYVVWLKSCTYGEIVLSYSSFVKRNYGRNSVVVFDGYAECCSTKEEEQNRRSARSSCKITFDENTTCAVSYTHLK